VQSGDDLSRISGVGPVVAGRLADAGMRTFQDVASSTPEEVAAALVGVPGCTAERIRAGDWIGQARRLGGTQATRAAGVDRSEPEAPPFLSVLRLGRARIRPIHDPSRSDQPTAVGLELRPGPGPPPEQTLDYTAEITARRLDGDGDIVIVRLAGVVQVDRGISISAAGPSLEAGLYRLVATVNAYPPGHDPGDPPAWSQATSGDLLHVVLPADATSSRGGRPGKPHPASKRLLEDGVISEDEYAELQTAAASS
jgi:hypothetical protein